MKSFMYVTSSICKAFSTNDEITHSWIWNIQIFVFTRMICGLISGVLRIFLFVCCLLVLVSFSGFFFGLFNVTPPTEEKHNITPFTCETTSSSRKGHSRGPFTKLWQSCSNPYLKIRPIAIFAFYSLNYSLAARLQDNSRPKSPTKVETKRKLQQFTVSG